MHPKNKKLEQLWNINFNENSELKPNCCVKTVKSQMHWNLLHCRAIHRIALYSANCTLHTAGVQAYRTIHSALQIEIVRCEKLWLGAIKERVVWRLMPNVNPIIGSISTNSVSIGFSFKSMPFCLLQHLIGSVEPVFDLSLFSSNIPFMTFER